MTTWDKPPEKKPKPAVKSVRWKCAACGQRNWAHLPCLCGAKPPK